MSAHPADLQAIGQIAVNVRDLPRATAYYRDVLGLRFLFEGPGMAFFDAGGVRLMLAVPSEPRYDHAGSIIYYRVADIHAAATRLAARGASFTTPPHLIGKLTDHELWMAFLDDSEGNTLALMAEQRG